MIPPCFPYSALLTTRRIDQLRSSDAHARVRRFERDPESVRHVLHRNLVEVVENQNDATFLGDGEEGATREVPLLVPPDDFVGRIRASGAIGLFPVEHLVPVPRETPVVGGTTKRDREEPRAKRARPVVLGKP